MRSMSIRGLCTFVCIAFASGAYTTGGFADQNGGVTGGFGGKNVTVSTGAALHEAVCGRSSMSEKLTIYVSGTINHSNVKMASGSGCGGSKSDAIELNGVSNLSIIGKGAIFDQIGIHIVRSRNIILQNLHIKNVKKSNGKTSNGGDAIGMETDNSNIWVDHCTLEASGGESDGFDGLLDQKNGTKYVTVSYTIFKNSGRGGLVGDSDSDSGNGPVTFHHNFYQNMDSHMPLVRQATAHSYNNYFYKINKSAIDPRAGAKIRVEKNYFKSAQNPLGALYASSKGYWHTIANTLDSCSWSHSYTPAKDMTSTTNVSIGYSYKVDDAECVPSVVGSTAGANMGLRVSTGSCSTTSTSSFPRRLVDVQSLGLLWGLKKHFLSKKHFLLKKLWKKGKKTSKKWYKKTSKKWFKKGKKTSRKWGSKKSHWGCTSGWGNCNSSRCCRSGYSCYRANAHYCQCRTSCRLRHWSCERVDRGHGHY